MSHHPRPQPPSRPRQALHVALKDVRLLKWPLLVYLGLVILATVTSVRFEAVGFGTFGWSLLLMLAGAFIVGALIQADSPAAHDAFWVTRPLSPDAVFAAKLLTCLVVLCGVALVGQALALRAHHVSSSEYPLLLARSTLAFFGSAAMLALIAALTRSFRSMFLTLVAILVASQIIGGALLVLQGDDGPTSPPGDGYPLLFVVSALLIVWHQYRTRRLRRGVLLACTLVAALLILSLVASRLDRGTPDLRPAAGAVEVLRGRLDWRGDGEYLAVVLEELQPRDDVRYRLLGASARLIHADGSSDTVTVGSADHWLAGLARIPPGMKWHDSTGLPEAALFVNTTSEQRRRIRSGTASLAVHGVLEVHHRMNALQLPLREGETAVGPGLRIRILPAAAGDSRINIAVSRVFPAADRHSQIGGSIAHEDRNPEYLVINEALREAAPLTPWGATSNGLALVLPGPNAWQGVVHLSAENSRRGPITPPDEEWMQRATLHVTTWRPAERYPVQVTLQD